MDSSKQNKKHANRTLKKRKKSDMSMFRTRLLIIILGIVAIIILAIILGKQSRNDNDSPKTAVSNHKNDFGMLVGNWRRPDGGYILKIISVDPGGIVSAEYYNPKPINISEAFVNIEKARIRLFIKLQDKGYPGSTYTLFYKPSSDSLLGVYYQAARGKSFEVAFVRKK
jgi:hypothetical protein